jgi:hypothetical protein
MPVPTRWLKHIRAWKASGDTALDYCGRVGLNAGTLKWWAWKLESEKAPTEPALVAAAPQILPTFVELAPLAVTRGSFEIEVAAVTVRVPFDFESDTLIRLIDALEARR